MGDTSRPAPLPEAAPELTLPVGLGSVIGLWLSVAGALLELDTVPESVELAADEPSDPRFDPEPDELHAARAPNRASDDTIRTLRNLMIDSLARTLIDRTQELLTFP